MKYQDVKESLIFLALTVFFGGGLILSGKFVVDGSAWNYIVIEALAIMTSLGLGIVLILWAVHIFFKKSEAQDNLPGKLSKSSADKYE